VAPLRSIVQEREVLRKKVESPTEHRAYNPTPDTLFFGCRYSKKVGGCLSFWAYIYAEPDHELEPEYTNLYRIICMKMNGEKEYSEGR
jgi:hypothetical protein